MKVSTVIARTRRVQQALACTNNRGLSAALTPTRYLAAEQRFSKDRSGSAIHVIGAVRPSKLSISISPYHPFPPRRLAPEKFVTPELGR